MLFLVISFVGSFVVAIRPWRFWQASRFCHQCKTLLTHKSLWGWGDHLDCSHCGCRFSQ
jgi:hypothetical protein